MELREIASNDLKTCKLVSKVTRFQRMHSGTSYIVFGVRSGFQVYCNSLECAKEEVKELVCRDRELYAKFDDEVLNEDYFIVECNERLHTYYVEEKEN